VESRVFTEDKRLRRKRLRSQLSEQFGLQINFGRSHTGMAAVTSRLMIAATIVPALFPMSSVQRV
jgi:hypothetical protein